MGHGVLCQRHVRNSAEPSCMGQWYKDLSLNRHRVSENIAGCGLWVTILKGGDEGNGIVWVVQQEPDELVILFHK